MCNNKTQATIFKNLSKEEAIQKFASILFDSQKNISILPSIIISQFILETGYGLSELCQNANNCFGLKETLSNNTWEGSIWDNSIYKVNTQEQLSNGEFITMFLSFRKYDCIENCITDYMAYILNAKNNGVLRYKNIKNNKNYIEVAKILNDNGYATSFCYANSLIDTIKNYDLTKFDKI